MAYKESMRLIPPVPSVPRCAMRDTEFGGYRIPAGARVAVNALFTHHMPELWPEPDKFDPLRFTDEASRGRHKFAFVPFGGGAHMCLGMHFANMQAKCFAFHLLSTTEVSVAPGYRPDWRALADSPAARRPARAPGAAGVTERAKNDIGVRRTGAVGPGLDRAQLSAEFSGALLGHGLSFHPRRPRRRDHRRRDLVRHDLAHDDVTGAHGSPRRRTRGRGRSFMPPATMDEIAALYAAAIRSERFDYDKTAGAFALKGRITLMSAGPVRAAAERALGFVVDLSTGPPRSDAEVRAMMDDAGANVIDAFAQACRAELAASGEFPARPACGERAGVRGGADFSG